MAACAQCGAPLPGDARFCPSCGATANAQLPSAEERKLATVLFADLVGSTALGGSQDPERTRATLDRFYEAMAAEIERAGGTVEKFAGDAVMAAFGAPAALEDHAERTLHAALAMRHRLQTLFGGQLSLRFGVNTGDVVVGRPREGSSFVTGDAVNVAARLEEAAAPGEILVGERTAFLVRGAFELGAPRRVEAKGKDGGVVGIPLLRALTLMRPRGVGGLQRAFVGRDGELDLLLATYARTVEQRGPHMVTLMGDAGVGKTRLVRELWERLGGKVPEPLRRTGRCLAYGHGITYWALGEILKEHLGILESDPPETVRARLGARAILGLALGIDTAGDLHPLAARDHMHDAWVELFDELAAERPVVLLVEDLHWAEEPLLDLLERLLRDVDGPLFMIGTARPELLDTRPSWSGGLRNASQLWLEPLRAEHTAELIDGLLAAEVPERLRDVIVERAEGNPFFVEELIAALIDRGVLERHDGEWRASDLPDEFELPDTVQAVVAARMDLLPFREKTALQAAAIAGRTFWEGPLVELLEGVRPDLELLETHDFLRRRSGSSMEGEREWAFKHAVTREVAYASLPKARRARLHAAFAGWLERLGGGRDEYASLLAHHYAEAVRPEDADLAWREEHEELARLQRHAVQWLRRAADLAILRYELDEGIALLERALELEPEANERAEIWRAIGRTNALGFRGHEFWEAMERSLDLTVDARIQGETLAELGYQTSFRAGAWRRAPEREAVAAWIEQALALTEPGSAAHTKALCADIIWSGATREERADEASEAAERLGDPELRSVGHFVRAVAAYGQCRFEDALDIARIPLSFVDELRDPDRVVEAYEAPIPLECALGHFDEARALVDLHLDATRPLTAHHRLHSVALAAETDELRANWEALRAQTPNVERTVEENLDTPCVRNERTLLLCAAASYALGDLEESKRLQEKAKSLGMEGYDFALSGARLRLALLEDDVDALEGLVEIARSAEERRLVMFGLTAQTTLVEALVRLGDRARAEPRAETLASYEGTYLQPFGLRALGQLRGERLLVERALARFEAMGLDWHAERTRALL
jgi:class 3 adenylate cyclase